MTEADVVTVSHPAMLEVHAAERGDLLLLENGVDLSLFSPLGDMPDLDRPVVGFHGAIRPLVDFGMIRELAQLRPEYNFVLVGPVLDGADFEMEALLGASPNVVHIPGLPANEVAAYVRAFDVGLIPYRIDHTIGVASPMKLNEFLASGVPPVSTPIPICVDHPAVRTGATAEELARKIDEALAVDGSDRARLREMAAEFSWDKLILPLLERLDERELRRVPTA